MDTRVYIQDQFGYEIEVDIEVRNKNGDLVGVVMEGPDRGTEFVLPLYMVQRVERKTEEALLVEDL